MIIKRIVIDFWGEREREREKLEENISFESGSEVSKVSLYVASIDYFRLKRRLTNEIRLRTLNYKRVSDSNQSVSEGGREKGKEKFLAISTEKLAARIDK